MKRIHWEIGILLICVSAYGLTRLLREEPPDADLFKPLRKMANPFQPITKFEATDVGDIGDQLNPDETVLGVTVNGQSRAYPINMLSGPTREIINDDLGGIAIAATW